VGSLAGLILASLLVSGCNAEVGEKVHSDTQNVPIEGASPDPVEGSEFGTGGTSEGAGLDGSPGREPVSRGSGSGGTSGTGEVVGAGGGVDPGTGGSSSTGTGGSADPGTGGSSSSGSGGSPSGGERESYTDPNGTIIFADQPTMPQTNAASPGDTLLFEPGEHDRIDVDDVMSTECAPLVLASLDPADPALIKNTTNPGWEALGVEGSEYVVIEDLIVEGGLSGIRVARSDHVIILRTEIRYTGHSGLSVNSNSHYVDFVGNTIHDTGQSEPKWGEGIYLGTAASKDPNDITTHIWMEDNEIYQTGGGQPRSRTARSKRGRALFGSRA